MCGIMGYYAFSDKRPIKNNITKMFELLESRGKDSSGFAFIKDKNLIVHKAPLRSSSMIKTKEWKSLDLPKIMILHTRMKTQGSEKNNLNNHPLYNKEGIAIVHNGMIHNDKEIFGKSKPDGECDSESILFILSSKTKGDRIKKVFEKVQGSFAVAMINEQEPQKLTLIKKDNPIDLYYDQLNEILYFCSEREIMQEALGIKTNTVRGFNVGEGGYHYYQLQNEYCLTLNSEGVEKYKKYSSQDYWGYRGYDDRNTLLIDCPHCLSRTYFKVGRAVNACDYCGAVINEEELYT